jgi:predicted MFS family arabinose efflux permease
VTALRAALWVLVTAKIVGGWGLTWDIQWHVTIGRDSFWIAPHVMMYAAVATAAVIGFGVLGLETFTSSLQSPHAVRFLGLRGTPGFHLAAWGVALVLLAALRAVERPSLRRSAWLGVAIGATVLVRGEAFGLLALVVVPVVLQIPRPRLRHLGVAIGVALAGTTPPAARGLVMGGYSTALYLGLALGSFALGPVIERYGYEAGFAIGAAAGAVGVLMATALWVFTVASSRERRQMHGRWRSADGVRRG